MRISFRFSPNTSLNWQRRIAFASLALALLFTQLPSFANGQMINVGTPFNSVGDSYFERMGVNFGFSIPGGRGNGSRIVGLNPLGQVTPNINFGQNGFGSAVPPFGNYDPGASARFGFGNINSRGGGFSLGFEMGKGSNRTSTSTVPSITVPNGYGGSIGDGAFRPFVTGVVPVVSAGNIMYPRTQVIPSRPANAVTMAMESGQLNLSGPVREREPRSTGPIDYGDANSSASTSDISVAAIKARRAAKLRAQRAEAETLVQKANEFIEKRDFLNARVQLRRAIKLIEDRDWKASVRAKLADIRGK